MSDMSDTHAVEWTCPRCGCDGWWFDPSKADRPFWMQEDGTCLHCASPGHMATHRQHEYDHSHAFIQWKGTQVCMDFYCLKCNYSIHIDDSFVYYVECPSCKTVYMTGWYVDMVELTPEEAGQIRRQLGNNSSFKTFELEEDE